MSVAEGGGGFFKSWRYNSAYARLTASGGRESLIFVEVGKQYDIQRAVLTRS